MRFSRLSHILGPLLLFSSVLVSAQQYPITTLREFPNPTWLDSSAVRHNGDILVTSATTNQIFLVRPRNPNQIITVASIPNANGANGIAELEKDVFYINGANYTFETGPIQGTYGVWKLDFRGTSPKLSLVTMLPEARIANGITRLHPTDNTFLLISDSITGSIIRVNAKTGEYATVMQMAEMLPQPGFPTGVSVLRTYESYLYFNVIGSSLRRVPISITAGLATGPLETILFTDAASFILSRDGTKAWMSSHWINALQEVDIVNRQSKIVVQNQTDFITPTGAALGRKDGKDVVYIITGGGYSFDSEESVSGGKLIRVDVE
ncbi:hypothetical protein C7974DRAFT_473736 [Boeremia exigua]|uniref:uncharacterized protein n=1 Tax=Boeremia exigua TaxID=749465 RepID=UPI001E8EE713|nr:uncharacterized protein C7974DRAFT_473736 [Boeremia exigua]KAH6622461.1 hypothetical protein C7974DRAFT_473736 [Boeremia exigua]